MTGLTLLHQHASTVQRRDRCASSMYSGSGWIAFDQALAAVKWTPRRCLAWLDMENTQMRLSSQLGAWYYSQREQDVGCGSATLFYM